MQRIVEDTASHDLLTALESNMIAFWSAYGRGNGNTLRATTSVVWFYTGIQVSRLTAFFPLSWNSMV